MTHGSLFAGIGGFDLGFERAGIKTIWQVEIDPYCRKVLARHFPDAERFADIRECGKRNLAPVDILSGGFPCQDISNAGKRAGIDGERSGLWSEYARIISELRPRFVVVENVAALLGRGMGRVLGDLAACGYDAEWQSIRASDVGAPHRRERIWIIAYPSRDLRRASRDGRPLASYGCRPLLADANRKHGRAGRSGRFVGHAARTDAYTQSLLLSHRNSTGLSGSLQTGEYTEAHGSRALAQLNRSDWWAVEPDVGGSSDGLPLWLDRCIGRGMSYAESCRASEVLRDLWNADVSQALWRAAGGLERVSQAEVLFAFISEYEKGSHEARLLMEGKKASEDFLRGLRVEGIARSASCKPRASRQPTGEHSDALLAMSRLLARDSEADWQAHSWEDAVPRVANGIAARVDRLKGLGNAIVPQIAEWIGRRIVECEL